VVSVETFLLVLRLFSGRRSAIISDNTSTYLAAADELKELFHSMLFSDTFNRQRIDWKFVLKYVP